MKMTKQPRSPSGSPSSHNLVENSPRDIGDHSTTEPDAHIPNTMPTNVNSIYVPLEIVCEIFKHLPDRFLWTTCRKVSRVFKAEVESIIRRKYFTTLPTLFQAPEEIPELWEVEYGRNLSPLGVIDIVGGTSYLGTYFHFVEFSADDDWAYFETNQDEVQDDDFKIPSPWKECCRELLCTRFAMGLAVYLAFSMRFRSAGTQAVPPADSGEQPRREVMVAIEWRKFIAHLLDEERDRLILYELRRCEMMKYARKADIWTTTDITLGMEGSGRVYTNLLPFGTM